MTPEGLNPNPREIKFAGKEKAEDIKRGFAITTLRNPRPAYDFASGEVILADCFDSGEKVEVVVLTNETKKVKNFSSAQIALDGFLTTKEVIDGMKTYPGYEKINKNYELQAITFVTKESYDKLPELLRDSIRGERFDEIIKMDSLRHLFFPTMAYNLGVHGYGLATWVDFMEESLHVSAYDLENTHKVRDDNPELAEYYIHHPEAFAKLALAPTFRFHQPFILGLSED